MKKSLILAGSGGCMRELIWQIEEWNKTIEWKKKDKGNAQEDAWEILGYTDVSDIHGDVKVGNKVYPYLGTDNYLLEYREKMQVAVTVGSSCLRKKIAEKLMANPNLEFPNLILSNTCVCEDIKMGKGNIISMDCRISTNVILGDFNFLNMGAVVCHDGRLGDYVTMSPGAWLAGNVAVGSGTELGMGSKVIQGITIGNEVIAGAGSVVIRNLPDSCKAVGVPAKER